MAMGGRVEQQIIEATTALMNLDAELADQVRANDDKINQLERAIDEECSRILARRQPTASDLRLVYAIIKTITDLERIGDEARKIGRMAKELASQERIQENMREVQHLSRQVSKMVHDALDEFARMDVAAAMKVARQDRKSTRLNSSH